MNTNPIKRKAIKKTYTKNTNYIKKKKPKNVVRIFSYIFLFFIASAFIISLFLYVKYIKDLPKVTELENLEIAESSTIYDKNGKELYKIFKEKRTYVEFEKIGKNMINAIVAGEDKGYWDNPGVDIVGLFRAGIYYAIGKTDGVKGTSTLTQQLIRNTIITNERSIERKVKEIYLAYKLTAGVSKEKILELYLNKISFGHNAFGIEEAAKTFFDKSAMELSVLESSILSSLPKGPTYYSPYNHPDRTLGYLYFYDKNAEETEEVNKIINLNEVIQNQKIVNLFKESISNLKGNGIDGSDKIVLCGMDKNILKENYDIDSDGCSVLKYSDLLTFLNNIKIETTDSFIEYQTGRKDYILQRMLEDGYIEFDQYKESILNSFGFEFSQSKENIKAPHFVFYVKEYLEEKYGKEIISVGGLSIYTTLDLDLQEKAEEIVEKQVTKNIANFNAKNAALISLDNSNGDIVAMVGGVDYFDKENKGNVNIITSDLQPGSTFKPFVYALAIYNSTIGTKTPVYDLETRFPSSYTPGNFDGDFMGKMNISTALNNSRNIPAIKMFYLSGGEKAIVGFMEKLGVKSLKNHGQYGAPLALGTGEMSALELAGAYSVFANLGKKVEINPILKIVDSKGNIIEEKLEIKKEEVVSPAQSYIINNILSDKNSRPEFWNTYLGLYGRTVAAKTGTSTKQFRKNGVEYIYPRNLWTIGYTPQYTTVVWAGNTDGTELNYRGNGLEGAGPIWKNFMEYVHSGKPAMNWYIPKGIEQINISEITGLLPNPENNSSSLLVESLFINKPTNFDNSYKTIQIDSLCNGIVTDSTPIEAIKNATILEFHSLLPENASWENPVLKWAKSDEAKEKYSRAGNIITSIDNKECVRPLTISDIEIGTNIVNNGVYSVGQNYIEIAYRSSSKIQKINIILNGNLSETIELDNQKQGVYVGNLFIPASLKNERVNIELKAIDEYYYSKSENKEILIGTKDTIKPEVKMENPIDSSISLYNIDFFNLKAKIIDNSNTNTIIYIDDVEYKNIGEEKRINIPINQSRDLELGLHIIKIQSIDKAGNIENHEVKVMVLEK